ncbi:MAG: SocA family protein, partial [Clostridia bacterium]|nr:SocA family protein [Clostridia bacterium]
GNMKIQKLLFFANFISIIERNKSLFPEKIRAFQNGCVVEEVRLRYKNDYMSLFMDSREYNPNFTQEEYDILNLTIGLFGHLSARQLSELNHSFSFWKNAFENSTNCFGYKNKESAIISKGMMLNETQQMKTMIETYRANQKLCLKKEIINGVSFFYDNSVNMDDEIINELVEFSLTAEDSSYSVYKENNKLVIY